MSEEDLKLIVDLSRVRADIVEQLMKWVPESEQLQHDFFLNTLLLGLMLKMSCDELELAIVDS